MMDDFSEVAYEGISVSDDSINLKNTETNNNATFLQDGETKIISKRSTMKSGLLFLTCIGAVVVCIAQIGLSSSIWNLLGIGNEKKENVTRSTCKNVWRRERLDFEC